MKDVPVAAERRGRKDGREVFTEETKGTLPGYFLQNFHYQTGGYLTEDSADLYDMQVEVLFTGAANAMRRQALVPLYDFGARPRPAQAEACSTSPAAPAASCASSRTPIPACRVTGLDLSAAYVGGGRNAI